MEKLSNIQLTLAQGLAVACDVKPDRSSEALADILGVKHAYLLRRSVDARKKSNVHFVVTAGIGNDGELLRAPTPLDERPIPEVRLDGARPIVVGTGPAGLFAALTLAEAGLRPLVIERGAPVEERERDVDRYIATRVLDTRSNVQFGEGGAGTFSDGKLTTGKSSPQIEHVLETFVAAGAPSEIQWKAKPHIGTDVLTGVVRNMRERIIACGGDVLFHAQLVGMEFDAEGKIKSAMVQQDGSAMMMPCENIVLACGHSARDTFALLKELGFELEQKPFSIGVRIEHEQEFINETQYGPAAGNPALGAADYKLSCHLKNGRSVYTFCMCPGGEVVAASSEEGGLCVNGMSRQARDGANANAALLCNVTPEDYGDADDPLAGIAFQREWEQAAFRAGECDWHAPAQRLAQFTGISGVVRTMPEPSYPLSVVEAPISQCLPGFATNALREALSALNRQLHGFADPGALLTGIEARSSSPVRIVRDGQTLMATRHVGVYPCGEGAGYAGGIMSAALDGIRVAEAIMRTE